MWDSIAYHFYGDVKYIGLLLQNNLDLLEIYVFSAGTKVFIPFMLCVHPFKIRL